MAKCFEDSDFGRDLAMEADEEEEDDEKMEEESTPPSPVIVLICSAKMLAELILLFGILLK
jgi:hypothetical protein